MMSTPRRKIIHGSETVKTIAQEFLMKMDIPTADRLRLKRRTSHTEGVNNLLNLLPVDLDTGDSTVTHGTWVCLAKRHMAVSTHHPMFLLVHGHPMVQYQPEAHGTSVDLQRPSTLGATTLQRNLRWDLVELSHPPTSAVHLASQAIVTALELTSSVSRRPLRCQQLQLRRQGQPYTQAAQHN